MRAQGIVLCVCLALIYGLDISTPGLLDRAGQIKGTDFVQFYVSGSLARSGPSSALYDRAVQADEAIKLIPESGGSSYLPVYGPQVSLLFAPLAMLPYAWALFLWTIITGGIYAICCAAFWRTCPNLRNEWSTVIILAAGYPAFFNLVAHGQNSAIALACLTAAFFALRRNRRFLAGLALGMLVYKPQLGLVAACVFMLTMEWRVVAGAIVGAMAQLSTAWLYYGTEVMVSYARMVRGLGEMSPVLAVKRYQMHSLFAFWKLLLPWGAWAAGMYVLTAIAMIVVAVLVWRASAPLSVRFSFFLLATALVSPHLYVYDLVIVAPALLLTADWSLGHSDDGRARAIQRLIYFSYALPLAGWVAQFTHVQASVMALTGLSGLIALAALRQSPRERLVQPAAVGVAYP